MGITSKLKLMMQLRRPNKFLILIIHVNKHYQSNERVTFVNIYLNFLSGNKKESRTVFVPEYIYFMVLTFQNMGSPDGSLLL